MNWNTLGTPAVGPATFHMKSSFSRAGSLRARSHLLAKNQKVAPCKLSVQAQAKLR